MKKYSIFLCVFIFISSCTGTPYQKLSKSGGYNDLKIAPETYRVAFRGNGSTNLSKAYDFALLRSAEIAKQNGYDYFIIVNNQGEIGYEVSASEGFDNWKSFKKEKILRSYIYLIKFGGVFPEVFLTIKLLKHIDKNVHKDIFSSEKLINEIKHKYNIQ